MVEGRVCVQDRPALRSRVNNSVRLLVCAATPAVSPFEEGAGRLLLQHAPLQHPHRQLREIAEQRGFGVVELLGVAVEQAPTQPLESSNPHKQEDHQQVAYGLKYCAVS